MHEPAMRTAFFLCEYSLNFYVTDWIEKLLEAGASVDLFLSGAGTKLVGGDQLAGAGLHVHRFDGAVLSGTVATRLWRVRRRLGMRASVLAPALIAACRPILRGHRYTAFIGVEQKGLIWAGRLAAICNVPLIYYSLELFVEARDPNHPGPAVRREERRYHRRAAATVIQDPDRWQVLRTSNGIHEQDVLFCPVSVRGGPLRTRSDALYRRCGIGRDRTILLHLGKVMENRRSQAILEALQRLPEPFVSVFHNHYVDAYARQLQERYCCDRIFFSTELLPYPKLRELIASAAIGLVAYDGASVNLRLTAFASAKLALYLQAGIPVIVLADGNYHRLFDRFRCGELVRTPGEIGAAVGKILQRYPDYREEAFAAFDEFYDFNVHFQKLYGYLRRL